MRSLRSVWLVAALAMGCSGAEPFLGPASIDGRWGDPGTSVPGNSFEMDLTSTGSAVSGNGSYAGEAGPFGTLAVAGTVQGLVVRLDLTFTEQAPRPGHTTIEHFDGRFTSASVLEGSITSDTPGQAPAPASYRRIQ
jgi:hypothetical protein